MSDETAIWVVDRVEGDLAVLIGDTTEESVEVDRRRFRVKVTEGDVLRVPISDAGPDWTRATKDEALRRQRTAAARASLEELKRRDPGGDVVL